MSYREQADPYGRGSYCIVVALHGDSSREAEILRDFRDNYVSHLPMGDRFIGFYYRISPAVTAKLETSRGMSKLVSGAVSSVSSTLDLFI